MRPPINKKRRKRYRSAVETNAPPKVLRKDYASVHPTQDTRGGKLLATMGVGPEHPSHTPVRQSVSDPDPLSYAKPQPIPDQDIAQEEEIKRLGEEVESLKVVETEVHSLRNQTKNLETLLEAEVDMKKVTEAKNAELAKELENLHAKFSDL
ncbi:hypothetical protein Tco_0022667 [Tanacetum coccineum]